MESEKLPWDLEEEILSRVPALSLVRFKSVCKRWHALLNSKMFIENHLAHSHLQFILGTDSQMYSVCINNLDGNNPSIEMHKLVFDLPDLCHKLPENIVYCHGILLCVTKKGVAVWNPLLRQTRWLEYYEDRFSFYGIGYDNNSTGYKIFKYHFVTDVNQIYERVMIYEIASDTWKDVSFDHYDVIGLDDRRKSVSLNGALYWIAFRSCIQRFSFSRKRFETLSILPCKYIQDNTRILAIFKRDRLSILEQCQMTNEIKIWVTKEKITNEDGEDLSWIKFMDVSIPNFPKFRKYDFGREHQPCYFIDNNNAKRLVVCYVDELGQAYIYIVKGDEFKKIKIDHEVESMINNICAYVPSMVSVVGQI